MGNRYLLYLLLLSTFTSLAVSCSGPALPGGGGFVFVAQSQDFAKGSISVLSIDSGNGTLNTMGTAGAGLNPNNIALDPLGQFAYVANIADDTISMFHLDPSTRAPSSTAPATVATGDGPGSITVHPSGKFAYAANFGSGTVSMFSIDPGTGSLAATSPATIPTGSHPTSISIDANGKFAYVANSAGNSISMFMIDPGTGVLHALNPTGVTASAPFFITIHPSGKFAYALVDNKSIAVYAIDPNTGILSPAASPAVPTGKNPFEITFVPSGKFAYVANAGNGSAAGGGVSMYTIDSATGALNPTSPPEIKSGLGSQSVQTDSTGRFAYVANYFSVSLSMYTIAQDSGVLSAMTPEVYQLPAAPVAIKVTK